MRLRMGSGLLGVELTFDWRVVVGVGGEENGMRGVVKRFVQRVWLGGTGFEGVGRSSLSLRGYALLYPTSETWM